MPTVIQVKRGTASSWTSANTVLAAGEMGFETDTKKMKVGDGSTAWTSLGYTATDGDISGVTAGTGLSGGGTSGAVTLTNSMATEITAKADLIVGTGNATFDNLPVGANGTVLTADSSVSPTGLKWAAPAATSGPAFRAYKSATQTVGSNAFTKVTFNTESFDTASNFASNRFTPTTAGYYLINFQLSFSGSSGNDFAYIYFNGSDCSVAKTIGVFWVNTTNLMYFNGSTDYAEVYWYGPGTPTLDAGSNYCFFEGVWIRS